MTEETKAAQALNSTLFKVVQDALNEQVVSMADVVAGLEFVKVTCLMHHLGALKGDAE